MKILNVPRILQKRTKSSGSCGPSSVQQILAYYRISKSLEDILKEMELFDDVGISFDGQLGEYLLNLGFKVMIYTRDTKLFDPTWFNLSRNNLIRKLKYKLSLIKQKFKRYQFRGFINFLKKSGKIKFEIITTNLFKKYINKGIPIMVGVDDSLLYRKKRCSKAFYDDDINGKVWGHELVISGYKNNKFQITDPFDLNPFSKNGKYFVSEDELIANINSQGGYVIIAQK